MREGPRKRLADPAGASRLRVLLCALLGVSLVVSLGVSAPAIAAPGDDPVASGSLELTLSRGFKRQLKSNGVKMVNRSFTVKKGAINPTDGTGSLTLNGKLKFKHGRSKRVFKKVTVTLGPGGALKGDGTKLFKLDGGSVDRQGFGAQIKGVSVKLIRKGARHLNRKLGLHSLHPGSAGTLTVAEQPQTVRVKNGQVRVAPSLDPNGSVAFKLFSHCVNPLTGVHAIAPATQDSNLNFIFPVQGGTIGPDGRAGLTPTVGGSQILKDQLQMVGVCATVPQNADIKQTNLAFDLKTDHVFAEAVIGGYGAPLGGAKGVAIALDINKSNMQVDAHPNAGKVTIRGLKLVLSPAAIIFLNLVFPNSSGDPANDFKAGDLFGEATIIVNTR